MTYHTQVENPDLSAGLCSRRFIEKKMHLYASLYALLQTLSVILLEEIPL
jgi:hypothetical protein